MNQSWEEQMKRLKEDYDRIPDETSPERIWAHVQSSKRVGKHRAPRVGAIAGGTAAALIAGMLVMSQAVLPPEDRGTGEGQEENPSVAEPEDDQDEDTEEKPPGGSEEQPDSNRPAAKEITYQVEGSYTEDTFQLLDEDGFSFTTYIPEFFETERTEAGKLAVYAAFSKDQQRTDEPVWTVTEHTDGKDLETMAANIRTTYENQGYQRSTHQFEDLQYGDYMAVFENTEREHVTVILQQNEQTIVEWQKSYPVEMGDGINAVEQVAMDEWEWK
ncbi:hypothetical protein [Salibacterium qingdaonense]|uniref:DUF4367 domain-containing protein n=1 Tax=Salibacterium qingdaonense TaxID=266892 RepID=A0A1I4L9J7_9BACI|nr:hypothetical protein [Salibacterium qingdaonense]SFL87473.1 hypothetical protein SAMN04488054_10734 [Salibacterium qingdaonense]